MSSPPSINELCRTARALWAEFRPQSAVETAWAAFDLDPSAGKARALLATLLFNFPAELSSERRRDFLDLLSDPEIDPAELSPAGWDLVLREHPLTENTAEADTIGQSAATIGSDALVLALLRETPVASPVAERWLTRLRRWLLLSGEWRRHSDLMSALMTQASLNGGAWPFDEAERTCLQADDMPVAAYLPRPRVRSAVEAGGSDPVTQAVTAQYEDWPYPSWTRITRPEPRRLADVVQTMCPRLARNLPVDAHMLIAGCGSGRQAAHVALAYPDAFVTAIDVSQASLDYARRQCSALGIDHIDFRKRDLHDVGQLGRQFDAIHCTGVLHHLPDPERGLQALADILRPGGVMNLSVYSQIARLFIAGARRFISDLTEMPVSDDLLREVRRRFLDRPKQPLLADLTWVRDFGTLAGTHDLLLHRHEDPFDVSRIERALKRAGLRLLTFELHSPLRIAQYNAMFPGDPKRRDFNSWRAFEVRYPRAFAGTYQFWCCKDGVGEAPVT